MSVERGEGWLVAARHDDCSLFGALIFLGSPQEDQPDGKQRWTMRQYGLSTMGETMVDGAYFPKEASLTLYRPVAVQLAMEIRNLYPDHFNTALLESVDFKVTKLLKELTG